MPTVTEYAQAVRDAHGLVTQAAKRLGVSRKSVHNAAKKHPSVKQALDESRERTVDLAESKLIEQIKAGHMTAIIFFLKTQAKHRGYIEKQEVTNSGNMTIRVVYDD